MKKIILFLLMFILLSSTCIAMTNQDWDDLQHYSGGYMMGMTMRVFGFTPHQTAFVTGLACFAKEEYDQSVYTPDGKNGKGFQVEELVWGLLGTWSGMAVYDYSLTVIPRGVGITKTW